MEGPQASERMASGSIGPRQRQQVEAHLEKLQASPQFRRSQRRSELLGWAVSRLLAGETQPVKEYQIGREVFGKPENWDPRLDPIVRVEFTRLRQKLREYYAAEGAGEAIAIEFPAGSYVPAIVPRLPVVETPQVLAPVAAGRPVPVKLWPPVLAAALIIFGIVGLWALRRESAGPPVTTVAVLPFLDLTPGGQRQYLADGFSDELTNSLAMVPRLRAISRTSAFQFKGKDLDVREIGRRLAAGAVVEGSIAIEGDQLRVIVQLDRTTDGTHLWEAEYDRKADEILAVESEVAESVAHELDARLTGTPRKEFDPGPVAFNEYLEGVYEEGRSSPAALRAAMGHYESAIRLAPRYALADVRLASVHLGLSAMAGPSQQTELEEARRNLRTALSIEPRLSVAVSSLALVDYILDWDWRSAEAGFRRALELSPGSGSHQVYAWALMTRGRFAESERQYREAIQMDPLNPLLHYNLAVLFLKQGQNAAARSQLEPFLQRDPMWFRGRLALILIDLYEHRPDEAVKDLELAKKAAPKSPTIDPLLAMAYAESGQRDRALALMRQMEPQDSRKGYGRYDLALASAFLGDRTRLFYWLGKAVDSHEQQVLSMRIEPALAPYQQDAGMLALERRTGLLP